MAHYLRSFGYAPYPPLSAGQAAALTRLLERYRRLRGEPVPETEVTAAVLGRPKTLGELNADEADRVAAHLVVHNLVYSTFPQALPQTPAPFARELDGLLADRELLERVIAAAGWDTGREFLPPPWGEPVSQG
ncbi:conserved protein of unknown function [Candidatus Hydrogenisulfobacillus filiaventi]|uniref:Uncharacterized protein n=1 Tax=Candidatus Hydrogenisulfobacillus filiaventi TaxID=2707344 RepID=A0A6F8ZEP5_9FIRM|nr:hypothetical protein [Bacillota bacterium]CAB1128225.1 conserved protein of unknown function [Candidatus Hydrogenisulfobacillus filiaventi]